MLKLPWVLQLLPTAPEPMALVAEGGAGDAEEVANEEVRKADASGPILGILQLKIREAAHLERKEMINLHLACTA